MIALLTYPTRIESAAFQKRTENDSFSYRVWELHRVIADPASEAADVKNAKLSSAAHTQEIENLRTNNTSAISAEHRKGEQRGAIKVRRVDRIIEP